MGRPITAEQYWATLRWKIARDTGWTLAYIDALSVHDLWEYQSIRAGETAVDRAQAWRRKNAQARPARRARRARR